MIFHPDVTWGLQVAILMQGSDFINVSVVPFFDVNQFDLGDVFISPCRSGTYNEARDSFCKPCDVCTSWQFERAPCIQIRNSECVNCTVCTPREQQVCDCNERSPTCVTGNRVCAPLPLTAANISFDLSVSQPLSPLKERFLKEGLRTGFILFLSNYLQHSDESIDLFVMSKTGPTQYFTTFLINDMYSLLTKRKVEEINQDIVQTGLTSTFGIQSNTFSAVSQQRRRRLLQQDVVQLFVAQVTSQCVTLGNCSRFFVMSDAVNPCDRDCVAIPCPPGYTGLNGMCEICPKATYKSTHGNESCIPCPIGWTSDQGAETYDECRPPVTTSTIPPFTTSQSLTPIDSSAVTALFPRLTTSFSWENKASTPMGLTSTVFSGSQSLEVTSTQPSAKLAQTTLSALWPISGVQSSSSFPLTTLLPQTPAPPPSGEGGGSSGPRYVYNYNFFNMSFVQNLFFNKWNSGKAGTVQYITINEERDDWAMYMAGVLMLFGLCAIFAIGFRLFLGVQRTGPKTSKKKSVVVTENEEGKPVIPFPVKRPPPPPLLPGKRDPSPPHTIPSPHLPMVYLGTPTLLYRRQVSAVETP